MDVNNTVGAIEINSLAAYCYQIVDKPLTESDERIIEATIKSICELNLRASNRKTLEAKNVLLNKFITILQEKEDDTEEKESAFNLMSEFMGNIDSDQDLILEMENKLAELKNNIRKLQNNIKDIETELHSSVYKKMSHIIRKMSIKGVPLDGVKGKKLAFIEIDEIRTNFKAIIKEKAPPLYNQLDGILNRLDCTIKQGHCSKQTVFEILDEIYKLAKRNLPADKSFELDVFKRTLSGFIPELVRKSKEIHEGNNTLEKLNDEIRALVRQKKELEHAAKNSNKPLKYVRFDEITMLTFYDPSKDDESVCNPLNFRDRESQLILGAGYIERSENDLMRTRLNHPDYINKRLHHLVTFESLAKVDLFENATQEMVLEDINIDQIHCAVLNFIFRTAMKNHGYSPELAEQACVFIAGVLMELIHDEDKIDGLDIPEQFRNELKIEIKISQEKQLQMKEEHIDDKDPELQNKFRVKQFEEQENIVLKTDLNFLVDELFDDEKATLLLNRIVALIKRDLNADGESH